jgi:hypothetical protein
VTSDVGCSDDPPFRVHWACAKAAYSCPGRPLQVVNARHGSPR